jgi:menaquinone-dependent protoporphyrinogen oxidase
MHILIVVASRHGSTREIAEGVAQELRALRHTVDVRDAARAALDGEDAVIVGSAVYMGRWLPEARAFVTAHQPTLRGLPVWLFSSGPLGPPRPDPAVDPAHLAALLAATGARGHRLFGGKIAPHDLNLGEWLVTKAVHAPEGDYRDWAAIRAWADEIAGALLAAAPA